LFFLVFIYNILTSYIVSSLRYCNKNYEAQSLGTTTPTITPGLSIVRLPLCSIESDLRSYRYSSSNMIVAFTDRRRSSDGSHQSNVVRKSCSNTRQNSTSAGQMIVAFARRSSDGSSSQSHYSRNNSNSSEQQRRRPSASSSLRRNKGPSRKQEEKYPSVSTITPVDPPVTAARPVPRRKSALQPEGSKARPRREMGVMKGRSSSSRTQLSARTDVIVEFPQSNPRAKATRRKDDPPVFWESISRAKPTVASQRGESRPSSSRLHNQPERRSKHSNAARRTNQGGNRHSRQFEDAVDWRETSVDWGDKDDDENVTDENATDDDSSVYGGGHGGEPLVVRKHHREKRRGVFHSSQSTAESIDSLLSMSISSLLSIRKLDP